MSSRTPSLDGVDARADTAPAIPAVLARAELGRILESRTFRRSPTARRMLAFLVERTLANRSSALQQNAIALELLGRDPRTFDPVKDTSVRVEARRLRQKLAIYYAQEARRVDLRIELPTGTYVPVFRRLQDAPEAKPVAMMAVLPFENLTGDSALEPFCDGLTDDVTDALARTEGLRIVARTSAFAWKGLHADVREIARTLGADYLIEGSVQRNEDKLKVIVQAVRGDDATHLWSTTFHGESRDTFALQDRVAFGALQRVAQAIGVVPILPAAGGALLPADLPETVREAWYRGRIAYNRRTLEGFRLATRLFEQSVVAAPTFAKGWADLAIARLQLLAMTLVDAATGATAVREAAQRALDLDPELAQAHAALAHVTHHVERDWKTAEKHYLRAIRASSHPGLAYHWYAFGLMFNGRFDEADSAMASARQLDPLNITLRVHHSLLRVYTRDFERARLELDAVLEADPGNLLARTLRGATSLYRGDPRAARSDYEAALATAPEISIGICGLAQACAMLGERDAALDHLRSLQEFAARAFVPPYQFALVHTRLGEVDAAFAALEHAAGERDYNLVCAAVDPAFDRLAADPRWRAFLAASGLPSIPRPGADARPPPGQSGRSPT